MASRALTLLLSLLVSLAVARASPCEVSWFSEQLELLLAEYEREAAPSPAPTRVAVGLLIRHLSIHEHDSNIHLIINLQLEWSDVRLAWNETAWGCSSALVSAERVWTPDVWLASPGSSRAADAGDTSRVRLTSDGSLSWVQHLDLLRPLNLQLDLWPSDQHTATITFASKEHNIDELDLKIKNQDIIQSRMLLLGAWEITSIDGHVETLEGAGETRRGVAWTLGVRRHAPAHALAAGAVLVATLLLLLAATLLPPAARAPLAACATLATSLWLTTALLRLPSASDSPLLVRLMCAACVCGGAYAALTAAVLRMSHRSSTPPLALRRLLASALAFNIISLAPPEEVRVEGEGVSQDGGAWGAAARLLDTVVITALLITIFVLFCLWL